MIIPAERQKELEMRDQVIVSRHSEFYSENIINLVGVPDVASFINTFNGVAFGNIHKRCTIRNVFQRSIHVRKCITAY